ncbi:LysR substrate-binding domain-containing protein [Micromonospora mangrovi]|uniref:LysR substrate-binding domain-containing protein n=2 Tax=Micromonospora TaxID=1873 RepID=A0AAU7MB18_9ACTN
MARIERRWRAALFDRTRAAYSPLACWPNCSRTCVPLATVVSLVTGRERRPVPPGTLQLASEFGYGGLLDALRDDALVDVRQHIVDIASPGWASAMLAAHICVYADLPLADLDWLTGPAGTRNHQSVVSLCRAAGFEPRIRFTALNGPSGRRILEDGGAVALTSATMIPAGAMHTVRLAEDVRIRMTVSWRHGSTATATAGWLVRWLHDGQVRRLAECRPELLTEMRADPTRWPLYAQQEAHRAHRGE